MKNKFKVSAAILGFAFLLSSVAMPCVAQTGLFLIDDVHPSAVSLVRSNSSPEQFEFGKFGLADITVVRSSELPGWNRGSNTIRRGTHETNGVGRRVVIVGSRGDSVSPNTLSAAEAKLLARRLIAARFDVDVQGPGFRLPQAPSFITGRWTWIWRRSSGMGDIELKVSFDADGASPEVQWQYLTMGRQL
jgi:hypothetical protein